ncbi:hypothetical protein QL285_031983 [Trifolium repens]|nr:hypothetical protein QL285_031983 [Trifolium repens]
MLTAARRRLSTHTRDKAAEIMKTMKIESYGRDVVGARQRLHRFGFWTTSPPLTANFNVGNGGRSSADGQAYHRTTLHPPLKLHL